MGCGFVRFVRKSLIEKVARVPEADRPEEWGGRDTAERLAVAVQAGVITRDDLR
jgi:hypothetical protein